MLNGQGIRAGLLPAQLHGHDVIIFNEAFEDDVREDLLNGLAGEYPYITSVVGTDRGFEEDGGVIIVSKWPILAEVGETFGECRINGVRGISTLHCNLAAQGIPDAPEFKQMCEGTDCGADKGVMYAKVCKNNHPYHVFGLHLQANHDAVHQTIQKNQLDVVRQLIDDLAIPESEPVFVGGDFNLRRDSVEKSWIEARLNATYPSRVTDLPWICTYCFGVNDLASDAAEGQVVLDYIVTSNTHRRPKDAEFETLRLLSPQPWKEFFWEPDHYDLSDHYPLRGRFTFEWPDDQGC